MGLRSIFPLFLLGACALVSGCGFRLSATRPVDTVPAPSTGGAPPIVALDARGAPRDVTGTAQRFIYIQPPVTPTTSTFQGASGTR